MPDSTSTGCYLAAEQIKKEKKKCSTQKNPQTSISLKWYILVEYKMYIIKNGVFH